jgi:hypothetical protein
MDCRSALTPTLGRVNYDFPRPPNYDAHHAPSLSPAFGGPARPGFPFESFNVLLAHPIDPEAPGRHERPGVMRSLESELAAIFSSRGFRARHLPLIEVRFNIANRVL